MENPYSPSFGEAPYSKISRSEELRALIADFVREHPARRSAMITGVSGSGKTVFMTEIIDELKEKKDWLTIRLNPERNLLEDLLHKLTSHRRMGEILRNSEIDLTFIGIGVETGGSQRITGIEVAIWELLAKLNRQGKKVLVCIDEVSNTLQAGEFFDSYQRFIGDKLPLYFVGTGLDKNISALGNRLGMIYFHRLPRVNLKPLSMSAMAGDYEKKLGVGRGEARKLARMTMGYAFAFQTLGFYYYKEFVQGKGKKWQRVLTLTQEKLEECAYEKIWSDLSRRDQEFLIAVAKATTNSTAEIKIILGWNSNHLNQCRIRLIKGGVLNGDVRGRLTFALPFFREYVLAFFDIR